MLKGPCNKHHFFAHLQIDPLDNGDAEKNWTDGVQKSDVCCTGFSASTTGLRHVGFLRCSSAAPAVALTIGLGSRILILERGDWMTREVLNWDAKAVFVDNRYISPDTWYDVHGWAFQPPVHYFVGGATKMYGAALYRLRREDFGELREYDGISPAWPISRQDGALLQQG
jgi:hypothetical protein